MYEKYVYVHHTESRIQTDSFYSYSAMASWLVYALDSWALKRQIGDVHWALVIWSSMQ